MASNYLSPLNTKLDAAQIIRRAYDEPNNRIRVDAQVTATIGTVDIIIDAATGDNIKISNGTNTLNVNPDGSINVNTNTSGPVNNNVHDGVGNPITSSNNPLQNTQSLHTLTPDAISTPGTFNSLNAFTILDVTGLATIGFQLNPGTFCEENEIVKSYELYITDEQYIKLVAKCVDLAGIEYSRIELLKIFIKDIGDKFGYNVNGFQNSKGYICSELLGELLIDLGVSFDRPPFLLRPDHIEKALHTMLEERK